MRKFFFHLRAFESKKLISFVLKKLNSPFVPAQANIDKLNALYLFHFKNYYFGVALTD